MSRAKFLVFEDKSYQIERMNGEALRHQYEKYGALGYYEKYGADYRNPHEDVIGQVLHVSVERWALDLACVLDLACGSGEVTLALREIGAQKIDGVDPFTGAAYLARTDQEAEPFDFAAIAAGTLSGRAYSLIVCSFAMHLAEASRLPALAYHLAAIAPHLLILTPHKRPVLRPEWGWQMREEFVIERVRARLHDRSTASPARL